MKCPEKANIETESPSVLPGLGWEWGLTANGHELHLLGVMQFFYNWVVVMVAQLCGFTLKNH